MDEVINMARNQRSYSYDVYKRAMEMIEKLGITKTSRRLGIPERTLYYWKNGKYKPPTTKWTPEPSNELAYIIGVLNGDRYVYIGNHRYKIQLRVKDLEVAETFSRAMAKTLNKKYSTSRWKKSDNRWGVVYHSKAFCVWFKEQTLETLKLYIEHDKDTIASFLRGLYDSEGNHYIYKRKYNQIRLSNNNTELLRYVQYLLRKYFGIIATGLYIGTKAGAKRKMKNGEIIKTKHDNYQIHINRKQHTQRFLDEIGFNIEEKQLGLPRGK